MTPVAHIRSKDSRALATEAQSFLTGLDWCRKVKKSFLAFSVGRLLGVFLFHIEPTRKGVDSKLWVVVGDLPPAYVVCDDAPEWQGALRGYIYEMRRWVEAVRSNSNLDGIIPVTAKPTKKHAEMLASRLDFIQERILDDTLAK